MEDGSSVNVSQFSMSTHSGTHADAPFHYDNNGIPIDKVPVERYMGRALVVSLTGRSAIGVTDVESLRLRQVDRLLVRTLSCPDPDWFNERFTYFEPAAIRQLADLGVQLIGTDAHSMDPLTSKELPSHAACCEAGILILENLRLAEVPDGEYELIALPLKLVGADGSPVRAVLRSLAEASND